MASVYMHSRGKSPYWVGVFTDNTGKQRHRSTRTADKQEALSVCQKWQRKANKLRQATKLENRELVLETFITATQKAERGDFTEATARKMLDSILEATGQNAMRAANVKEFLSRWVEAKAVSKASRTVARYGHVIELFLAHIGTKAKMPLSAITPQDIETLRDKQVKEGRSGTTANLLVKTLCIPFNLARRQGLILTNPAEAVERLDAESAKRSVFTLEQLGALLKEADPEWRGMILLGATCGLRIGDAARLTWSNVDFERKVIRYIPKKTRKKSNGKSVETLLLPDLEQHLIEMPLRSKRPDAPLFPTLVELKPSGTNGLSRRFKKLMHKAGVYARKDERKVTGQGRRFSDLTFHSLRHTYISLMANRGVDREIRKKLAGHTSDEHDRYTHLELETMRTALQAFPSLRATLENTAAGASNDSGPRTSSREPATMAA